MIKCWEHFKTVSRHRYLVFILAAKSGIFFRGLVHDLSKYSKTEFFENVKYYNGKHSPIVDARKDKGYSLSWIHHKACNKHHYEYWYDVASESVPVMPYKYAVEMVCDRVAASKNYNGDKYSDGDVYDYFLIEIKKYGYMMNPMTRKFLEKALLDLKNNGEKYVFRKSYFKVTYKSIVKD